MQELNKNISRQVAWIGAEDERKKLYKRDKVSDSWVLAYPSGGDKEFHTYQDLRRQGYVLVDEHGNNILDINGQVIGDKPLPPAKSDISLEKIDEALSKLEGWDSSPTPDGNNPITGLLTLKEREELITFNEKLSNLPVTTLRGYALQVSLYVQPHNGTVQCLNRLLLPSWMLSCMGKTDANIVGQLVTTIGYANKEELLKILKQSLPEVVRLAGLRNID